MPNMLVVWQSRLCRCMELPSSFVSVGKEECLLYLAFFVFSLFFFVLSLFFCILETWPLADLFHSYISAFQVFETTKLGFTHTQARRTIIVDVNIVHDSTCSDWEILFNKEDRKNCFISHFLCSKHRDACTWSFILWPTSTSNSAFPLRRLLPTPGFWNGIKWNHPLRSRLQRQVILDVFFAYLAAMRAAGVDMELYKSIQAAQIILDRNLMVYFWKILWDIMGRSFRPLPSPEDMVKLKWDWKQQDDAFENWT